MSVQKALAMHPLDTPTLHLFFFIAAWPKTPASGGELDAEQCLEALLLGVDVFFAGKSWHDGKHILCTYAANQIEITDLLRGLLLDTN